MLTADWDHLRGAAANTMQLALETVRNLEVETSTMVAAGVMAYLARRIWRRRAARIAELNALIPIYGKKLSHQILRDRRASSNYIMPPRSDDDEPWSWRS